MNEDPRAALRASAIAADAAYLPDPAAHPHYAALQCGPPTLVAEGRSAWGFAAAADGFAWVALRGSGNVADWLANLDFALRPLRSASGRAHAGIAALAERVAAPLAAALAVANPKGQPVRIAGHSLGGALAQLLLVDGALPTGSQAITFGAPRVVDRTARDGFRDAAILRVANEGDPVPHLPPGLPFGNGYAHLGHGVRLAPDGTLTRGEPAWGPWVAELTLALASGTAEDRKAALARRLADHRTGAYLERLGGAGEPFSPRIGG